MTFPTKPTTIPKCSCLAPSEWVWDDIFREWYRSKCWRCLEIMAMKGDPIAKAIQPWDTDMIDRFVELIIDELYSFQRKRLGSLRNDK